LRAASLAGRTPLRASATSRLPLRQIRRDRRRFRTTDNHGSVRLPSGRPEPCDPGGLGRASCSRAQLRPAPCRLPRSLPAPSRAGGPLQAIPMLPTLPCGRAVRCEKDASHRLLQPTAPNEHPADCSIPGCVAACIRLAPDACEIAGSSWAKGLTAPGLGTRLRLPDQPPSGASLDGEPPASASAATQTFEREADASGVWAPRAAHVKGRPTPRSPGGASIDRSSAPSLPIRAFSATNRACDIASGVLPGSPM
jgi:hypothetical protein